MLIKDVIQRLEQWAPPAYQESYDNSGLLVGDPMAEFKSSLACLDCTEEIVEEAIERGANLIVAHHPIVFRGLKRFTGSDYVQRTVIKAIKNDIAIYAIHTNLDNVRSGVNDRIADRIGLASTGRRILMPKQGRLCKLEVYVPQAHREQVEKALFKAGAGSIGDYSECSFHIEGTGGYKPMEGAEPFDGEVGKRNSAAESLLSVIYADHLGPRLLKAMKAAHPYEEVAYQIIRLENSYPDVGSGILGQLPEAMTFQDFVKLLKQQMNLEVVKHTAVVKDRIQKVAIVGGSGVFGLGTAIAENADVFITGDVKHHEYFDADGRIILMDIGHYESEHYTIELIQEHLAREIPNFAHLFTGRITNPVKYA